jgi:ketosteroid isomerase-like protein
MLMLIAPGLQAQQKRQNSGDHEESKEQSEVNDRMQELRAALLGKDSVALEDLLTDDLTYGHSNGWIQTKSGLIRSVMSGEQAYKKLEPGAIQIRIHGNTAIVNFESLVALDFRGEYMELDMDILLVWVWMNGKWKLIARQSVKNS